MEVEYKPLRDELGRLLPGQKPLNPNGRPAQKSLKEYAREWYLGMTDEQKLAYILALEEKRPGFAWTMSEGNPTEDKNIRVSVPVPILGGATEIKQIQGEIVQEVLDSPKNEA